MSKKERNYKFNLNGVDVNKVRQKYGIRNNENIPNNTTKIDDLDISKKNSDIISFLDETRKTIKCNLSIIDNVDSKKQKYKCYWDKEYIPENVKPIRCPIKFIPSRATKTYHSEISKDQYSISEQITEKRKNELKESNDPRITTEYGEGYQTKGIFCSFNCCMAFILDPENQKNPMYRESETLLLKIYNDLLPDEKIEKINPAHHWETLIEFGGFLTIKQFRETLNKVSYRDRGIFFYSIGRLFEEQLKF